MGLMQKFATTSSLLKQREEVEKAGQWFGQTPETGDQLRDINAVLDSRGISRDETPETHKAASVSISGHIAGMVTAGVSSMFGAKADAVEPSDLDLDDDSWNAKMAQFRANEGGHDHDHHGHD